MLLGRTVRLRQRVRPAPRIRGRLMTVTNDERADRALAALATYCDPDGEDRTEQLADRDVFEEVVSDLLADLHHLARRNNHDPAGMADRLADRAWDHYTAELVEEADR